MESFLKVSPKESMPQVSTGHQSNCDIQPSISSIIFFDIETSDFQITGDILEIGAVWGDKEFDVYITPQSPINEDASAVNNITFVDNVLYYKGQKVEANTLADALRKLLTFLKEAPEPRILIGHNIKKFDCPYIFTALSNVHILQDLEELIVGFIDTFPLYKELKSDLRNYKQVDIIKSLLNIDYEEHNALADVKSLQEVFYQSHFEDTLLIKHFFTCLDVNKNLLERKNRKKLTHMKRNPWIKLPLSGYMIGKIVKSGLSFEDLRSAFKAHGNTGLQDLLQGKTNGSEEITINKKIIDGLCKWFNDFNDS